MRKMGFAKIILVRVTTDLFTLSFLIVRITCLELVPTVMIDDLDKSCAKAEPNFDK
jgi:hypothetical protein